MSEDAAIEAQREYVNRLRGLYGIQCPQCKEKRPKQKPTLLLPQQRCKADGFFDDRPQLTVEEKKKARAHHQERANALPKKAP